MNMALEPGSAGLTCCTPPPPLRAAGQSSCPFGDGVLCLADAILASETCEELFTPQVSSAYVVLTA
jgi:NAD+ synthase (glutamine-hydrolysing)